MVLYTCVHFFHTTTRISSQVYICSSSWNLLPHPYPTPLGRHRVGASCVTQQLPVSSALLPMVMDML